MRKDTDTVHAVRSDIAAGGHIHRYGGIVHDALHGGARVDGIAIGAQLQATASAYALRQNAYCAIAGDRDGARDRHADISAASRPRRQRTDFAAVDCQYRPGVRQADDAAPAAHRLRQDTVSTGTRCVDSAGRVQGHVDRATVRNTI
ncbi:hypothetical protein D3C71_1742780 [compost metagenome]